MKDFETEKPTTLFDTWEEEHQYLENCKNKHMVETLRENFGINLLELKASSAFNDFIHKTTGDIFRYHNKWEKLPKQWKSWHLYDLHVKKADQTPWMVRQLKDTFNVDFVNDLVPNGEYYYLVSNPDILLVYTKDTWTSPF